MQFLRPLFFTLVILFTYSCALAQLVPPDKIRALTTDDGLPQGFVTGFVQDAKGFMWISTQDGLTRYDGRSFKNFRHDEASAASLASNIIDRIALDHENRIWLQYENGQSDLFDPVTGIARHISREKAFAWLAPESSGGYDVCEDGSDRIFILSVNDEASKRKLRYFSWKDQKPVDLKLSAAEFPVDMGLDQDNSLWVAGNRSLYVSARNGPLKRICTLPSALAVPSSALGYGNYRHIQAFEKGRLLCYDAAKAWLYNIAGDSWQKLPVPAGIEGDVNYFEPGQDGSLYYFSGKAVYHIDQNYNFLPVWINDTKYNYNTAKIDRSNIIWVGTNTFGARLINLNNSGFRSYRYNFRSFFDILPEWYGIPVDNATWTGQSLVGVAYSARSSRDTSGTSCLRH
jgi:hypothetical protein